MESEIHKMNFLETHSFHSLQVPIQLSILVRGVDLVLDHHGQLIGRLILDRDQDVDVVSLSLDS